MPFIRSTPPRYKGELFEAIRIGSPEALTVSSFFSATEGLSWFSNAYAVSRVSILGCYHNSGQRGNCDNAPQGMSVKTQDKMLYHHFIQCAGCCRSIHKQHTFLEKKSPHKVARIIHLARERQGSEILNESFVKLSKSLIAISYKDVTPQGFVLSNNPKTPRPGKKLPLPRLLT